MKLTPLLFTMMLPAVAMADAPTARELLQRYKCDACHAESETKAGPAYVDIATRYAGKRQAITSLSEFVTKGARGGGPWHMPPHPEISTSDAKTIAQYILSLGSGGADRKN
jgi:cytochrome c